MYTLKTSTNFVAQHFLTVPDCGPENEWHSHHFEVDVLLEGESLNANGYLVDITEVEAALGDIEDRYRDATLNELPEFEGLNPSIEHFARIVCYKLRDRLPTDRVDRLTVKIWEDENTWGSYQL